MAQHIANDFNSLTQHSGPSPKIMAHEKPRADNDLAGLWPTPLSCLFSQPQSYPLTTENRTEKSREEGTGKITVSKVKKLSFKTIQGQSDQTNHILIPA